MNFKPQIEKLLKTLKDKGVERGQVEEDLGYSENYIDQMLAKGGNKRFLTTLQKYVLQNTIPGNGQQPASGAGAPPATIPITWQEYIQLIHLSLEALRAGQSQILNQQARTIAEVRGYGQYQIQREVNWDQEKFVKLMERVGTIIGANLKVDDEQDNS